MATKFKISMKKPVSFKQRIGLIVGLTFATSFILFSTVYLPYFGNIQNHRADFEKEKLERMKDAAPKSASMWKNMDEEVKKNS